MTGTRRLLQMLVLMMPLAVCGCRLPGKPAPGSVPQTPEQVTDFKTLYNNNCAACHGENGRRGAAVSLADPAYLAYAGEENIARITALGIGGSLMPAFGKQSGGLLTDQQVQILARGMVSRWSDAAALHGGVPPVYQSGATGNPERGAQLYGKACVSCHAEKRGGLLDPTYLALISDGGLRTILVSGKPEQGMPDWQDLKTGPLSDQEIADIVSYLEAHRAKPVGQRSSKPAPEQTAAPLKDTQP